ncbi:uncharacterized protein B0P05DRAFT_458727, partial [Gilbertella persicaria]|uniref:uncharacterized protein n=1 Tax=Gilbertella persicaria TaxID=101096 RepID=UPI002221121B
QGSNASSIIDYVYCCNRLQTNIESVEQTFISRSWTDHSLLVVNFNLNKESTRGPGAWKSNPNLAKKKEFRQQLAAFLDTL